MGFNTDTSREPSSAAHGSRINHNDLAAVLERLESGQRHLMEKVDLQLQRSDLLLQRQRTVDQHPHSSEIIETNISRQPSKASSVAPATSAAPETPATLLPSVTRTGLSECEEDEKDKIKDLKAYQKAMGWQKTVENLFPIDSKADFITRFASGPAWISVSIMVIVVSTLITGIETQLQTAYAVNQALSSEGNADTPKDVDDDFFRGAEIVVLAWMIFEVLVNAYAQKKSFHLWH